MAVPASSDEIADTPAIHTRCRMLVSVRSTHRRCTPATKAINMKIRPALLVFSFFLVLVSGCEPDQYHNGCQVVGNTCKCGYGCKTEYVYKTRRACRNALKVSDRSPSTAYVGGYERTNPSAGNGGVYERPNPSPGYERANPSAGYERSNPSAGYERSNPSAGYEGVNPSAGYGRPNPNAGYERSNPSASYERPSAGYGSGYERTNPSAGYGSEYERTNPPSAGYGAGYEKPNPSPGYGSLHERTNAGYSADYNRINPSSGLSQSIPMSPAPQRGSNVCSSTPCSRGICIQTTNEPGFTCKCEGTGYYGQRCEKACPTTPMRGMVFPHECVVI